MDLLTIFLTMILIPMVKAPIPGTFFWKPRLGLDLSVPTTQMTDPVNIPSAKNIYHGLSVFVDGYDAGMTLTVLCISIASAGSGSMPHLDPTKTYFYTEAYRWSLKYASSLPVWLSGTGDPYVLTHKLWNRRFLYLDNFVPSWLRLLFPWLTKADWAKEEEEMRLYKRYAEPWFAKYYRYPSVKFDNFTSFLSEATVVQEDDSVISISGPMT